MRPVADFGGLSGAIRLSQGSSKTSDCALNDASSGAVKQYSFNASLSSSLYKDNLTEVRVKALYGLNLIKAF